MTAPTDVLSLRALNRAFMARQLMIERSTMPVVDAVEHLVGLQAQVPLVPYTSLWSRLDGFDPFELGRMVADRDAVRTHVMRSTIHLVTARDALFLRPMIQPVLDRVFRSSSPFGRAVAGIDEGALLAAGRELLEAKPLSRAKLSAALVERFPGYDPLSLAYTVTYQLPLVQIPPRGVWGVKPIQATWTTLSSWLGTPVGTATPKDYEALVLRYLAAFGPASVMDVQNWCWLTRLGAVVERLRPQLLGPSATSAAASCSTCPTRRVPTPRPPSRRGSSGSTTTCSCPTMTARGSVRSTSRSGTSARARSSLTGSGTAAGT